VKRRSNIGASPLRPAKERHQELRRLIGDGQCLAAKLLANLQRLEPRRLAREISINQGTQLTFHGIKLVPVIDDLCVNIARIGAQPVHGVIDGCVHKMKIAGGLLKRGACIRCIRKGAGRHNEVEIGPQGCQRGKIGGFG